MLNEDLWNWIDALGLEKITGMRSLTNFCSSQNVVLEIGVAGYFSS